MFNYIRSLFCKHDFVLTKEIEQYREETDKYPTHFLQVYFCNKLLKLKKVDFLNLYVIIISNKCSDERCHYESYI